MEINIVQFKFINAKQSFISYNMQSYNLARDNIEYCWPFILVQDVQIQWNELLVVKKPQLDYEYNIIKLFTRTPLNLCSQSLPFDSCNCWVSLELQKMAPCGSCYYRKKFHLVFKHLRAYSDIFSIKSIPVLTQCHEILFLRVCEKAGQLGWESGNWA